MDIKTRLTRCCGKDMGSGLTCHDSMRCPDCFDKLEGWREIEQLQLALGAMVSAYDHDWEVGDAVVRCRKIMADGQKPWDEIEVLKGRIETLQQVVRDQHEYGVKQLLEMDTLKEVLLAIKQESNEDNIREIAHQALL